MPKRHRLLALVSPLLRRIGGRPKVIMNGSSNHSCTIRYSSLNLQAANTCGVRSPRVAVHLHLHYVELLDELLRDIAHIPGKFDLFVTTTRSATSLSEQIHAWFPSAIVWQTENRGRDIGPFIDAIERHNLDQYELVLKVHGKRSVNTEGYMEAVQALFGPEVRTGDDWRRGLIRPLLASSWRVAAIFNAFAADVALGMVGAARFVCQVPDSNGSAYALLCSRLDVAPHILFFGGTMFWIRGHHLKRFRQAKFSLFDFDSEDGRSTEGTLAHACERVFGALVAEDGGWVAGIE